jgi:hypothetical protein
MAETGIREENSKQTASKSAVRPAQRGETARRTKASVQNYLDRFSAAMTSGDTKAMAALWQVPAFVIGSAMTRLVQSSEEVEQFYAGAKDMYNARGIVGTRAEILDLDWVDDDLVTVRVRWPYLDAKGEVRGEEASSYTLLQDETGEFKLRVIVMRGEGPS